MKDDRPTRYSSDLRRSQTEATRNSILEVLRRKLDSGRLEEASFAEIAAEAGVAERTVYRHFPTREALLGAFWAWIQLQPAMEPSPPLSPIPVPSDIAIRPMRNQ